MNFFVITLISLSLRIFFLIPDGVQTRKLPFHFPIKKKTLTILNNQFQIKWIDFRKIKSKNKKNSRN